MTILLRKENERETELSCLEKQEREVVDGEKETILLKKGKMR